jgi:hypothetical protein
MADCDVLLPKNVNVQNFKYSTPKTLSNGSRTVYVTHNSQKLSIQTPIMRLPYGVGEGYEASKDADKPQSEKKEPSYDLHVSFIGQDDNPKVKALVDLMLAIETQVKQDAFKNRVAWLDDDFDGIEQVVNKLFTPIVKYDKDKVTKKVVGKYPPTMKLKLPYDKKTSMFQFETQDMDGNLIDFKLVMRNLRGGRGKFIIQLGGLWFAGGKFGCTWKVVNAKVEGNAQRSLKFIEESDDEDEKKPSAQLDESDEDLIADAMDNATINTKSASAPTTQVAESDEEEDDEAAEEEEEDDEPPPPPPPKKTAAKKATTKK